MVVLLAVLFVTLEVNLPGSLFICKVAFDTNVAGVYDEVLAFGGGDAAKSSEPYLIEINK